MNTRIRGIAYSWKKWSDADGLPDLVFLHGFMGSGEQFRELISYCGNFCNPVTIDLLGHGETEGAELHYRFSQKEQVADLKKLLSEQLQGGCFLYGYSMGARLALSLASRFPELLYGLILESGTFGIENETERQARQSLDGRRADAITGNYQDFLKSWKEMELLRTNKEHHHIREIQNDQNPRWMANSLLGFGTGTMPCLREQLPYLPVPVQLITGERDQKYISINQVMNKEISDCTLDIVPHAGHKVHLDRPEETSAVIRSFISKHFRHELDHR